MPIKHYNIWEISAAFAVAAIGVAVVWTGSGYSIGTPRRMGPGFFPVGVGSLLVVLGLGLLIEALRNRTRTRGMEIRPFAMVMAAILAFGVLMERTGLIPATVALVVLASLAESPVRPLPLLGLVLVVPAMGVVIFIMLLGLPLSPLRW